MQTATQADVNRFLNVSFYMSPSRSAEKRLADLQWRFPAEDVASAFAAWQHRYLADILPAVQAEIEPNYCFCECGALLDFAVGVCPGCGHEWCPF